MSNSVEIHTSLAQLGFESDRNPVDILHQPMHVNVIDRGTRSDGTQRRLILAQWPGVDGDAVMDIFNCATREPEENLDFAGIYADVNLPYNAARNQGGDNTRELAQMHLQSPLIGKAFLAELAENEAIRLTLYQQIYERSNLARGKIRLVDLEKFVRWFIHTSQSASQNATGFTPEDVLLELLRKADFMEPFLRSKHVPQNHIQMLMVENVEKMAEETNLHMATGVAPVSTKSEKLKLIQKYSHNSTPEEILAFYENLPLHEQLRFLSSFSLRQRWPELVDPKLKDGFLSGWQELHIDFQGDRVEAYDDEYSVEKVVLKATGESDERGFYPQTIERVARTTLETAGSLVPTLAWIEHEDVQGRIHRRLLSPAQTHDLLKDPAAITTLGRAVAIAVSSDMYPYLPFQMKLEQRKEKRANEINMPQIGTVALNETLPQNRPGDSIPRRLARQPIFDNISQVAKAALAA